MEAAAYLVPFAGAGGFVIVTGIRELCRYKIAKLEQAVEMRRLELSADRPASN